MINFNSKTRLVIFITLSILVDSCKKINLKLYEPGVSLELAQLRDKQINNLQYNLSFHIPDSVTDKITGIEIVEFDFIKNLNEPLILDFRNPESHIKSIRINNKSSRYKFENEHIIIPNSKLKNGKNQIKIEFISGDRALNRNKEYLYTLFVPDRACTAFPCFDQPSLKAKFQTELTVPLNWIAVTNTPQNMQSKNSDNTTTYKFNTSKPISTYLYSFVAGKFTSITKTFDGRNITMYHREDDTDKLNRNTDKLFELHISSLKWLENYTQIEYPFQKFDFVIIPSFQYSGMEHPGAILYRDSRVLLDENPTIREELNRANLIAHETAHIWFGDLVTMEWFSEVWLKEVFANFMAGKIVNPQYPEINHDLNFLINHYPPSYKIDRTKGANPIEQVLDNMKNAGTLYGNIIYHKAPIVMNHLEKTTGEQILREGLQKYLEEYSYGNACWDSLVSILDSKIDYDLDSWNKSWIYEPGMPYYIVQKAYGINDLLQAVIVEQIDPTKKGREWDQKSSVLVKEQHQSALYPIELTDTFNTVAINTKSEPSFVYPNPDGLAYGYFKLDEVSSENILKNLASVKDPTIRCSMYMSLWENMLNQNIKAIDLFNAFVENIKIETNSQNISLILSYTETLFWKFLTKDEKDSVVNKLENTLWNKSFSSKSSSIKKSCFNTYYKTVSSKNGINNLYQVWSDEITIPDLNLSEKDLTEVSFELTIRGCNNTGEILSKQKQGINNKEKQERFDFISQAIINRDVFFESLKDEKNREKEPWVIDALYYLHHPLKQNESVKYIIPSLELLEELQSTGDIFFPKRWLDATFYGHSSIDAVMEINLFLNENPDYPDNLKNKILQSTDLVCKSSIIKNE